MKVSNFTPLDIHQMISDHFPHEKRTFNAIFLLIGVLTAVIFLFVGYVIFKQRFT